MTIPKFWKLHAIANERRDIVTIKSRIGQLRTIPKGIMFRDITTLIKDPVGFRLVIDNFTQRYIADGVD